MNFTTSTLLLSLLGAPSAASDPLCAQREPCRVLQTLEAGQDTSGQSLRVKHLSLGWWNAEVASNASNRKFGPGRKAEGSRDNSECEAQEWWLLHPNQPAQLLLTVCNDGYGAAGIGKDEVRVGENLFSHERSGGSNERWSFAHTLRLSPLTLVHSSLRSFHAGTPENERGNWWDVTRLRGETTIPAPSCAQGEPSPGKRTLPYLPRIQVEKSYLQGGWKQAGLGTCALEAAHLVHGTQEDPKDAALKAVLVEPQILLIEVRDDRWTGPNGTKWLTDDHVELWLGQQPPQEMTGCGKPRPEERAVQWGIRIADGQVFPAHGSPKQKLTVEKVEIRESEALVGYRLKVTLPKGFRGVSVLYSDSDEGQKQERVLATSPLKFARPETLNAIRLVTPEEATCVVRGGELTVVPTPLKVQGPDVAALFAP
jgi:hypothetical protein